MSCGHDVAGEWYNIQVGGCAPFNCEICNRPAKHFMIILRQDEIKKAIPVMKYYCGYHKNRNKEKVLIKK